MSTKLTNSSDKTTSDRIVIDRMRNEITINVKSIPLILMEDAKILEWIRTFIHTLEVTPLSPEPAGDTGKL